MFLQSEIAYINSKHIYKLADINNKTPNLFAKGLLNKPKKVYFKLSSENIQFSKHSVAQNV